MKKNKSTKILQSIIIIIIFSMLLISCKQHKDYYPSDDIPLTDIKSYSFPMTLDDVMKRYNVEYSQFNGFYIEPKNDSIFLSSRLIFNCDQYNKKDFDYSYINEEIQQINLTSRIITPNEFKDYLTLVEEKYGTSRVYEYKLDMFDKVIKKEYLYWILKKGNILVLYYDHSEQHLYARYTVNKIENVEEYF